MRIVPSVALLTLFGCDTLGQIVDPPVESADYLMFAIGAVVPDGPPAADFQNRVPLDMTHFFDNADPANPEFVCQHDEAETLQKVEELQIPNDLP